MKHSPSLVAQKPAGLQRLLQRLCAPPLAAGALVFLGSALIFGLARLAFAPGSFGWEVFFVSPLIVGSEVLLFSLGLVLLLRKATSLWGEEAALEAPLQQLLGSGPQGSIDRQGAGQALGRINALQHDLRQTLVVKRLEKSLRRLHITGSTGELGTILRELADLDQERLESEYTLIRFLLAVIPIVGFIGTVLGISQAIGGFPAMLQGGSAGLTSLQEPISAVTGELGVAFNTTFLALVQAGILMLFQALIQRREETFLGVVNEFCISEVLNRVLVESEGVQFKAAIEREMQDLRLALAEQNEELLLSFQELVLARGAESPGED